MTKNVKYVYPNKSSNILDSGYVVKQVYRNRSSNIPDSGYGVKQEQLLNPQAKKSECNHNKSIICYATRV